MAHLQRVHPSPNSFLFVIVYLAGGSVSRRLSVLLFECCKVNEEISRLMVAETPRADKGFAQRATMQWRIFFDGLARIEFCLCRMHGNPL